MAHPHRPRQRAPRPQPGRRPAPDREDRARETRQREEEHRRTGADARRVGTALPADLPGGGRPDLPAQRQPRLRHPVLREGPRGRARPQPRHRRGAPPPGVPRVRPGGRRVGQRAERRGQGTAGALRRGRRTRQLPHPQRRARQGRYAAVRGARRRREAPRPGGGSGPARHPGPPPAPDPALPLHRAGLRRLLEAVPARPRGTRAERRGGEGGGGPPRAPGGGARRLGGPPGKAGDHRRPRGRPPRLPGVGGQVHPDAARDVARALPPRAVPADPPYERAGGQDGGAVQRPVLPRTGNPRRHCRGGGPPRFRHRNALLLQPPPRPLGRVPGPARPGLPRRLRHGAPGRAGDRIHDALPPRHPHRALGNAADAGSVGPAQARRRTDHRPGPGRDQAPVQAAHPLGGARVPRPARGTGRPPRRPPAARPDPARRPRHGARVAGTGGRRSGVRRRGAHPPRVLPRRRRRLEGADRVGRRGPAGRRGGLPPEEGQEAAVVGLPAGQGRDRLPAPPQQRHQRSDVVQQPRGPDRPGVRLLGAALVEQCHTARPRGPPGGREGRARGGLRAPLHRPLPAVERGRALLARGRRPRQRGRSPDRCRWARVAAGTAGGPHRPLPARRVGTAPPRRLLVPGHPDD